MNCPNNFILNQNLKYFPYFTQIFEYKYLPKLDLIFDKVNFFVLNDIKKKFNIEDT